MKTVAEIQAHISDLRRARDTPCNCAMTIHAEQCRSGFLMLNASIESLQWVIGTNPRYEVEIAQRLRANPSTPEGG